jgi:hypothetical protein
VRDKSASLPTTGVTGAIDAVNAPGFEPFNPEHYESDPDYCDHAGWRIRFQDATLPSGQATPDPREPARPVSQPRSPARSAVSGAGTAVSGIVAASPAA